ncbi:acetylornithine transaminase [Cohnella thailandensis]|uniref:Acetylornithine aminotransferase n=1 Tax=Cohnella thailandensis TaxID=557557 RepID=A0A841SRM3_9BACL|nr:acetylornithine transaminase [Cohnella thailandensis]MBB6632550.1 acetylornithine transaminase [Cohnella thailandensis]MBP1971844.1 acetylornithine aminotransferase [Cohnella thailandensis]
MSSLFPTFARYPITIVKGKGSRLWDDQGKEYLDFMTGIAVTSLGHVPERVKNALVNQLDQLWHVSNLFYNPNQEKAAKLLTDNSCADAVFFCNSGAEANEAAIKIARRYHQKVLGNERYEIVTFTQSFHGRTLATLTATGQDKVKEGFLPLPVGFVHVPLNDIEALKAAITDKTAAIMLELIQAEGGVLEADPQFVREVRELCDREGILLILDEIQTGMGRTGKLFAYEHYGIEPDIFTLAKGIGSGFPVGAMLAKAPLIPAFTAGSHGSTFSGTPIATAAIIATIETMLIEQAPERAAASGELLISKLRAALNDLPNVVEVRGRGLLVGIECAGPVADIVAALQQRGLLVITAGPNVLRLLPNLLIAEEEIDEAVGILASVLSEQLAAATN